MARSLLFINKYPNIVKEFTDAMGNKEIEIDTALDGKEAAEWINKKEYQVIVTGVSLEGFNGEQIITHLNRNYPNTVCIIYTTNISAAQLHFFINERNVFRVFLRPVDFNNEFNQALEEAFEYYDVRVKNQEEEGEEIADYEKNKEELARIQAKMKMRDSSIQGLCQFAKRLAVGTLREYNGGMDAQKLEAMRKLEWKVADLCCAEAQGRADFQSEIAGALGQIRAIEKR